MDFTHSDEQLMLRDAARSWLHDRYPADRLAQLADAANGAGADPGVWQQLAELGWVDAATEGAVTAGVLLEQTAYALLPAPFFVTVALAAPLGADPLVPTTLAWAEAGAPQLCDPISARVDGDGRVFGHKILVPDLSSTTHAVITTDAGARLVAVADATVITRSTIDHTRRLGELVLDGTPSTALPPRDLTTARTTMLALAACEAVGVAQKMLDMSAAHANSREQFGRRIGSYQAVSHRIADMYVALELSRSLAVWACWCIDAGDPSASVAAAAAKAMAGPAAVVACEQAIQVHGGIGFTWDSVLHRYYKRAQWLDAFEGGANVQRASVARAILEGVA